MLIGFFTALIWLVHPVNTQSVTFIVQRMNSMAAMFYMLSLLCYIRGRTIQLASPTSNNQHKNPWIKPWIYFSCCVISGLIALASKQNTAMLPVFIFLYEWFFFQDLNWDWLKAKLLWIVCIIFMMTAIAAVYLKTGSKSLALYSIQNFTLPQRLLTESRVLVYYFSLIFFPHPSRLNLDYDYPISTSLISPPTTLMCLFVLAGLATLGVISAKKNRLLSFSILWFFGNLAIESSFIGLAPIFEHRIYLPSMMIICLFVMLLFRYVKVKQIGYGIVFIAVVVLSTWTFQRNMVWQDAVTFWHDCIKKSPNKANPYDNLGYVLLEKKDFDQAISYLKTAIRINPDYAEAHYNLGVAYQATGQTQKAIDNYLKTIQEEPYFAQAYCNLGHLFYEKKNYQEATRYLQQALKISPDLAEAHNSLGLVLKSQNRPDQAIAHFQAALAANPELVAADINIGTLLTAQGKTGKAMAYYSKALTLDPDNIQLHNNIGNILAKQGRFDEAIKHYTRALEINPKQIITLNNMGNALLAIGKYDEAIRQYQAALSIDPKFKNALYNLAMVYAVKKDYAKSIDAFKRILTLEPKNAVAAYDIACIYSRQNKKEEAVKWLKKAVDMGYNNRKMIKTDQDLENIRSTPYYKSLIKKQ